MLTAKYYIRPRREENAKKWQGPYDAAELKDLAERRLFSKQLHEFSEDRLNWIPARQIWSTLFPTSAVPVVSPLQLTPASGTPVQPEPIPAEETPQIESVAPLEESPDWYYSSQGAQQGPLTISQLRTLAAENQLQPEDLVWSPACGESWVEAQTIPEIFPPEVAEPVFFENETAPRKSQPLYASPMAVASFVLAILGATLLCGLSSIPAVICGHLALSEYSRSPRLQNGKWMAITGLCLGYLTILFLLFSVIAFIVLRAMSS